MGETMGNIKTNLENKIPHLIIITLVIFFVIAFFAKSIFKNSLNFSADQWINDTGLVRTYNSFANPTENVPQKVDTSLPINMDGKALNSYLPDNKDELQRRVIRYRENYKQLIQMLL